jgi:hypothetical protein
MANRQNTLLLKRSNVIGKLPPLSGLTLGEMALNTADAKLYSLFTSGTTGATEVREIGWNRIHRTGDTVTGDFNFFGDISISGSSLPNGYALAVTGDTDFKSDVYVEGDIYFSGDVITTGSTIIQNGLTANTIYTDYIDFNLTATSVHNEGRLNWNDDTKTLEIDTEVNDFSVEIGQENVVRVSNKTGNLLTKGTLVFITGGTNNRPTVTLASRDAERTSARTLGFVGHNIDPNAEGYVVTYGLLRDINTIAYTAGTQLYLFTGGTWTNEKPIAPDHDVRVGVVVRQSLGAGIIFVTVQNGYELDEIHDVRISGLTAGDLLVQSSFNSKPVWVNTKTLPGNYTISGNTTHIGNFNITGNSTQFGTYTHSGDTFITGNTNQIGNFTITGNTTQSGDTTQLGNFHITGNTSQIGVYSHSGDTIITGNTTQLGDITLTGNTTQFGIYTHSGDTFITGNTTQIGNIALSGNSFITGNTTQSGNTSHTGSTSQIGDVSLTGNTDQLGYLYIISATTGCTLAVTGNTCLNGDVQVIGNLSYQGDLNVTGNTSLIGDTFISGSSLSGECALYVNGNVCIDGDVTISGDTFMSGDFCMNNMNSTGQTGTNCFDTSLIPTGTTIIHQFQSEGGVFAHLGDLATGEPNSRGFTYFENNTVLTSFVAVGTGVYTPVIGAPQTVGGYANLFIVTTGATTATTNKLTYNYPPASGTSFTYLKFTVSLSVEVAQNQQLTFQIQRTRGVSVTNIPIGMSITPNGNSANGVSFNGIAEALHLDEFVLVVRNATGSGGSNSVRITDVSFSMFT